jgi:glycosyltransferase involved in cell wall biosynthesis
MTKVETRPTRVLRIINRFNVGGPVYNVTYLTKYLPETYETLLIGGCATQTEQDATYILSEHGIQAHVLPSMSRSIRIFNDLKTFYILLKLIRSFKPDIVHTHASKAGVLGRIAAKTMGVQVIVHTYHGHVFHGYFNPTITKLIVFIERILGKITTKIITISTAQQQDIVTTFRIAPENKTAVIPLGFDLTRFEKSAENRMELRKKMNLKAHQTAVAIVGRIAPIKNHRLFIDAAAKAYKKHPEEFIFYVVGDGELRDDLTNYISTTYPWLNSSVIFTSWIADMTTFYPAMDLVCLTSINEGTPVSLIEAQASGIPVLSTNVGGVKDVIHPNETGIILNEHSAEELSNHLIELHLNSELRIKMSQNARNFVKERYTYYRLVDDIDGLYKTLLSNE